MPPDPKSSRTKRSIRNSDMLYIGKKAQVLHYSEGARLLPNANTMPKAHRRAVARVSTAITSELVHAIKGADRCRCRSTTPRSSPRSCCWDRLAARGSKLH